MITFFSGMFCCRLSLSLQSSMDTSFLLKDYFQLDPRVRLLGAAFRFWARQVKVEGSGGLPPHAISLLLVSFLQKQAVLPVIPATGVSITRYWSIIILIKNSSIL